MLVKQRSRNKFLKSYTMLSGQRCEPRLSEVFQIAHFVVSETGFSSYFSRSLALQKALESLSADQSSTVMSRLSSLYHDLHSILLPVLPSSNATMTALISPLSPTSSPLRSSRNFLREVLDELRKNCAPARDAEIDDVLSSLLSSSSSSETFPEANLPSAIMQTIRSIFSLVQEMTDDLHHFASIIHPLITCHACHPTFSSQSVLASTISRRAIWLGLLPLLIL